MDPTLVVIGISHRTAPIDVRQRFWMNAEQQRAALAALTRSEAIEETFVFSTCNRTEFVVYGDPTLAENSVLRFLSAQYDLRLCEWGNFYRLLDEHALAHAFRVSCGLDSMRIGEGQIGREVNSAWQQARTAGCTGPFLDAVLRTALAVRRKVRSATQAGFNLESAPQAAVELAAEIFGTLAKRNVVVLGAGAMGRAATQALRDRGVGSIAVFDRCHDRAMDVSRRLEVQAPPPAEQRRWLAVADLVISATSDSGFVLTVDEVRAVAGQRKGSKQILMDLALPRDIDPAVRENPGVLLYDLDDLDRCLPPRSGIQEAERDAESIVMSEVEKFWKDRSADDASSEVVALHHRLDEICQQELESFRLERGPFPKDQDQIIAALSSRITHRIAGSLARGRVFRLPASGSR